MENRRRYIRITTVLPVEFYILDENDKKVTPWLQGFTQDISRGGICININDLWWGFWDKFSWRGAKLMLRVNLPFRKEAILVKAKVSWLREKKTKDFNQYKVGIEFAEADREAIEEIFRYVIFKKAAPVLAGGIVAVLLIFSSILFYRNISLTRGSRKLVRDYVGIIEKEESLADILAQEKKGKEFFQRRSSELRNMINLLAREITSDKRRYEELLAKGNRKREREYKEMETIQGRISTMEIELGVLKREKKYLKVKEREKSEGETKVAKEVIYIEKERLKAIRRIANGMYDWIKNRQDLSIGLVLSYEGDRNLDRVYFTYDQALTAILFLSMGDKDRAEKILDFYLEKVNNNEDIYNAYQGKYEVFEYVIHSGPNAWIGIAALVYAKETGSKKYLPIAKKISEFLGKMMVDDQGVKGGPKDNWYSTEHNLDSYAFFKLFKKVTKKQEYSNIADKIKNWISKYTYTNYGPPVSRGKGDSTIATDTYAWTIAAFGPDVLYSLKMNPESILEFAIENCEVEVEFEREDTVVSIKGFDFAKLKNTPRGGVVSGEWTAQIILALEIMASYFEDKDSDKSKAYMEKALFYFNELQKMIITSPSASGREDPCLPYASKFSVDTGHGWRTPKGNMTGSLSSTAYFLLAYQGYNPLKAEFLDTHLKGFYNKRLQELK